MNYQFEAMTYALSHNDRPIFLEPSETIVLYQGREYLYLGLNTKSPDELILSPNVRRSINSTLNMFISVKPDNITIKSEDDLEINNNDILENTQPSLKSSGLSPEVVKTIKAKVAEKHAREQNENEVVFRKPRNINSTIIKQVSVILDTMSDTVIEQCMKNANDLLAIYAGTKDPHLLPYITIGLLYQITTTANDKSEQNSGS